MPKIRGQVEREPESRARSGSHAAPAVRPPQQKTRGERSADAGGSSFAARFGRVILHHGIAAIPSALLHYQAQLNLSAQQVWFVSYVLSHKWDEDLPYPSLKKMAKCTTLSLSQLQRIKAGICDMGYLTVYPRYGDKQRQETNAYDFSPLFSRLEELIVADPAMPNSIRAEGKAPESIEISEWDPSFAARYGRVIVRRGVAAVPRAIFTHQQALALTPQQVWFITYIFSFQWDTALPYPSIRKMALQTGYSSVQLHNIKAELVAAGYLRLVHRATDDGGQDTNAYDFSGLLDAVRTCLQPQPEEKQADTEAPISQPQPIIRRRGRRSTTSTELARGDSAQLSKGGRTELPREDSTDLPVGGSTQFAAQDSARLLGRDRIELDGADSAPLIGRGRKQLSETGKEERPLRTSRAYQGGIARTAHEVEAVQIEEKKRDDSNHLSLTKGRKATQKDASASAYSPYIAAVISDFSHELNDPTHVISNVTQALRQWQISGLSEQAFTELLYEAKTRTRTAQGRQGIAGLNNKMAYFFRVLHDLCAGE